MNDGNVTVNYDPVGSGDGRTNFIERRRQLRRLRLLPQRRRGRAHRRQGALQRRGPDRGPGLRLARSRSSSTSRASTRSTCRRHDRADLRRQDHHVERPGHRRRATPTRTCPDTAITPGPPLGRLGHHQELHRLPRQGQRARGPTRPRTPSRSRVARPPRAPPASSPPSPAATAPSATPTRARSATCRSSRSRSARSTSPRPPRAPPRSSRPPRPPRVAPTSTWPSTSTATTTEAGAYPVVLLSYLIACQTYEDAGRGRPGQGLPVLHRVRRGPAGRLGGGRLRAALRHGRREGPGHRRGDLGRLIHPGPGRRPRPSSTACGGPTTRPAAPAHDTD